MRVIVKRLSLIWLAVFIAIFAIAYYRPDLLGVPSQRVDFPQLRFSIAVSFGVVSASWLVVVISWFGAAKNFFLAVRSKKPGASLANAGPFNSFYVLSNDYLNENGQLARSRLLTYGSAFLVVIVGTFCFAMALQWYGHLAA
jgi:hypothetical protein